VIGNINPTSLSRTMMDFDYKEEDERKDDDNNNDQIIYKLQSLSQPQSSVNPENVEVVDSYRQQTAIMFVNENFEDTNTSTNTDGEEDGNEDNSLDNEEEEEEAADGGYIKEFYARTIPFVNPNHKMITTTTATSLPKISLTIPMMKTKHSDTELSTSYEDIILSGRKEENEKTPRSSDNIEENVKSRLISSTIDRKNNNTFDLPLPKSKKLLPSDWPFKWYYRNNDDDRSDKQSIKSTMHTGEIEREGYYEKGIARWRRVLVTLLVVVLLIVVSTADTILWTRISKKLLLSTLFLAELVCPIFSFLIIWPIIAVRKFVVLKCMNGTGILAKENNDDNTEDDDSSHYYDGTNIKKQIISKKSLKIFFIIALSDVIADALSLFPIIYLDPFLVILLHQIYLPINMIIARLYMGKIYGISHVVGTMTILLGVVVNLIGKNPSMFDFKDPNLFIWISLLILSKIPASFGQNYKELKLKAKDLDVWWTTAWINTLQLPLSIPLIALVLVPMFRQHPVGGISDVNTTALVFSPDSTTTTTTTPAPASALFPPNLISFVTFSFNCLIADLVHYQNTTVTDTFGFNLTATTLKGSNDYAFAQNISCSGVAILSIVYLFINVFNTVLQTQVLKLTTSNLVAVASVLMLILSEFAQELPWFSGEPSKNPSLFDYVGVLLVLLGMINYWSVPEKITTSNNIYNHHHEQHQQQKKHTDMSPKRLRCCCCCTNSGIYKKCKGCFFESHFLCNSRLERIKSWWLTTTIFSCCSKFSPKFATKPPKFTHLHKTKSSSTSKIKRKRKERSTPIVTYETDSDMELTSNSNKFYDGNVESSDSLDEDAGNNYGPKIENTNNDILELNL
jgi:hypothetical protein